MIDEGPDDAKNHDCVGAGEPRANQCGHRGGGDIDFSGEQGLKDGGTCAYAYDFGRDALLLTWNATDRNLAPNPIWLQYAEGPNGPWQTIVGPVDLKSHIRGKQWGVGQWQGGQYVGIAPGDLPGAKPIIFPKPAW